MKMLDDRTLIVEGAGHPAKPVSCCTEAALANRRLSTMLTVGPGRMVVFRLSRPARLFRALLLWICRKPGEHCVPPKVPKKFVNAVPCTMILVTAPPLCAKFQAFRNAV